MEVQSYVLQVQDKHCTPTHQHRRILSVTVRSGHYNSLQTLARHDQYSQDKSNAAHWHIASQVKSCACRSCKCLSRSGYSTTSWTSSCRSSMRLRPLRATATWRKSPPTMVPSCCSCICSACITCSLPAAEKEEERIKKSRRRQAIITEAPSKEAVQGLLLHVLLLCLLVLHLGYSACVHRRKRNSTTSEQYKDNEATLSSFLVSGCGT